MDKLLLRPEEAAELIGVSRSKMYVLIADGVLPGVRVGKSVRVPVKALEAWVEAQTTDQKRSD
jgi:excisionase family DNA binding protein